MKLGGVKARPGSEGRHPGLRQWIEMHPAHGGGGCKVPHHVPQGMLLADLVIAICGNDERVAEGETATKIAQQVKRRVVGPVHVLEGDDQRFTPPRHLRQERRKHEVAPPLGGDQLGEPTAQVGNHVNQGRQRSGRYQRIAGARQLP